MSTLHNLHKRAPETYSCYQKQHPAYITLTVVIVLTTVTITGITESAATTSAEVAVMDMADDIDRIEI